MYKSGGRLDLDALTAERSPEGPRSAQAVLPAA
jgi:hypothetical protein